MNLATVILAGGGILSIDGSFLLIFVLVLLLIFVLNATLFKPIIQLLDERDKLGLARSGEAKKLLRDAEERARDYEAKIRAARAEAYHQVENRRRELKQKRQQMLGDVRNEVGTRITAAREEIAQQSELAQKNLAQEAQTIAAAIATQLLKRKVGPGGIRV